ncbi:MAG: hypothetical protein MUC63_00100 [Planctomycetes bacterium]|jgi:hypothetical protein|nr:hypothetical protein [Planctomycetota bacterium]
MNVPRSARRPGAAGAPARLALLLLALPALSCSSSGNGVPVADPAPEPPPSALQAYEALRREIYAGRFVALYDACSKRYRADKFPDDRYRRETASSPGLAELGLTSADVARLEPREVVATYFRLVPEHVRKRLIVALSETKVLGQSSLPDGRAAVSIESGGEPSRLLFVMEDGAWKMDGEEKGAGGK